VQQRELFGYFLGNYHLLPEVSPRMVADLAKVRLNFDDDAMWHRQLEKFLDDTRRQKEREEAELERLREKADRIAIGQPPSH
jgi:hypothetical protein